MDTRADAVITRPDRPLLRALARWSFLILVAVVVIVSTVSRFVRLPTSSTGNLYRGVSDIEEGRYQAGIESLTRAIQLDRDQIEAYKSRGYARLALGDAQGALEDYDSAVGLKPIDAGAYLGRGRSKEALGDLGGAIADYERAMHFDPRRTEAWLGRGSARAKLGDADGAQNDYTRGLQIDPRSGKAYLLRASLHFDEERWDEAIYGLEQGIARVDPGAARDGAQLLLWAARSRKGEGSAADAGLEEYARGRSATTDESTGRPTRVGANVPAADAGRWLRTIAGFLTGDGRDEAEADLLKDAAVGQEKVVSDRTCEALFFAAQKGLARGDEAGALERLRRCRDVCRADFYAGARSAAAVRSVLTGMRAMPVEETSGAGRGAGPAPVLRVTRVRDGGPAARAGLEAGDAIVTIEEAPATAEALWRVEAGGRPGDTVRLEIVKGSGPRSESDPGDGASAADAKGEGAAADGEKGEAVRIPAVVDGRRQRITLTLGSPRG